MIIPAINIKRITVLFNSVTETSIGKPEEKVADDDNIIAANHVGQALTRLGYEVTLFEVNTKTLKLLKNLKTDLIFNLLEGFDDLTGSFTSITTYIENLNVPITGSSAYSGLLTTDKARTKEFLVRNKIPTALYQLFVNEEDTLKYYLRYPLITKPNVSDCSLGITQDSVVKNFSELKDRITLIKESYKDATLAEEYIDGRELEVFVIKPGKDLTIFPAMEVLFRPFEGRKWNIRDFDHKWGSVSNWDEQCPASLEKRTLDIIHDSIRKAVKIFDIKGYCRFDIRVSKDNIPYVLEINVNPGLSIWDDMDNLPYFRAAGMTYDQAIQMIVDGALYEFENTASYQKSFSKPSDLVKS